MEDILKEFPDVILQKQLPSFVRVLLSDLPKDVMFICKMKEAESFSIKNGHDTTMEDSTLDVTGAPLQFSMYSLTLNESVVKKFWSDQEEKYLPLSLRETRSILGRYLLQSIDCSIPLWILCDGLDISKTLLMSAFKTEGRCSRSLVHYKGLLELSEAQMLINTDNTSLQNSQVECVFNLHEDIISDDTLHCTLNDASIQNCSKVSIKLQWQSMNSASLEVPQSDVKTTSAMDLIIGHKSSVVYSLWSQLLKISKYCEMLAEIVNNKESALCLNSNSVDMQLVECVANKILNLIFNSGNVNNESINIPKIASLANINITESALNILTSKVLTCTHHNSDIADKIWLLLSDVKDIKTVTACLNNVIAGLQKHRPKTQVNLKKRTFLGSVIVSKFGEELFTTQIADEKAVEVMLQTGIEKLKHDYVYIFENLNVECPFHFENICASIKSLSDVKLYLNYLAQMHTALEVIWIGLFSFGIIEQNLNVFAQNVINVVCQDQRTFDKLINNSSLSLEIPINYEVVKNIVPRYFLTLKLKRFLKETSDDVCYDYTVFFLSYQPIFPSSTILFNGNESIDTEKTSTELKYHIYQLSQFCDHVE